ncbi:hypothetical protein P3T76_005631 [Phytophthora citrophthora]|uniref:Uncharacterized protein n=1 Tax=Phytophthora citrophthora TaxID=4793 RepID=A0AAD9GR17_9STRA|nr:hypothetical protein P3T76_005631 [Phytophthora citrophthora]
MEWVMSVHLLHPALLCPKCTTPMHLDVAYEQLALLPFCLSNGTERSNRQLLLQEKSSPEEVGEAAVSLVCAYTSDDSSNDGWRAPTGSNAMVHVLQRHRQ